MQYSAYFLQSDGNLTSINSDGLGNAFDIGCKVKVKHLLAMTLLIFFSCAHAVGNVQEATVINVDARADGSFLITFSSASTTPPPCATVFNRMSGNVNSVGGKAVLAAAMLALSGGNRISLAQGTGACTEYQGIESISILSQSR